MTTTASLSTRDRVGISTITFRFRPLEEALTIIERLGAVEVDLGAIPDVTDHVPVPFTGDPAAYVADLEAHGLRAGAVNADIGHLNDPALSRETLAETVRPLVALAAATGGALIVPCGRNSYDAYVDEETDLGDHRRQPAVRLRALRRSRVCAYWWRCCTTGATSTRSSGPRRSCRCSAPTCSGCCSTCRTSWRRRTTRWRGLSSGPTASSGFTCGTRFRATSTSASAAVRPTSPATIGALEAGGFTGTYILELETHDVDEQDREADALRSREEIVAILDDVSERVSS